MTIGQANAVSVFPCISAALADLTASLKITSRSIPDDTTFDRREPSLRTRSWSKERLLAPETHVGRSTHTEHSRKSVHV